MNNNIKNTISILLIMILVLVGLAACGSNKTAKGPEVSDPVVIGDPKKPGDDAAYSHTNLIISVDKKFSESELDDFLKKYDVDLLYDYDSFNMYAVSTKEEKTIDELTKLASRMVDENPNITAAELDGIVTIYSTDANDPKTVITAE